MLAARSFLINALAESPPPQKKKKLHRCDIVAHDRPLHMVVLLQSNALSFITILLKLISSWISYLPINVEASNRNDEYLLTSSTLESFASFQFDILLLAKSCSCYSFKNSTHSNLHLLTPMYYFPVVCRCLINCNWRADFE